FPWQQSVVPSSATPRSSLPHTPLTSPSPSPSSPPAYAAYLPPSPTPAQRLASPVTTAYDPSPAHPPCETSRSQSGSHPAPASSHHKAHRPSQLSACYA